MDWTRRLIKVQRAVYESEAGERLLTLPKGGKPRIAPMSSRLHAALQAHRHLRGEVVLYRDDATPGAKWWLKWMVDGAERAAGLRRGGRVHILRHTTMRYMHLSRAAPRAAIGALEAGVEALLAQAENAKEDAQQGSDPTGIRTPVTALKGPGPGPLDDGVGRGVVAKVA